ncbi:MAG: hypothetical protein R3E39_02915 [Anaerolineae bacterium]
MIFAFMIFCASCLLTGFGINFYLFQSTVSLDASVRIGKGSGGVSGQVVYKARPISSGDTLRSDKVSQSTLLFRDSLNDDHLVAAITVLRETSLVVTRAIRPRFHFTTGSYALDLEDFSGELDVFVPKELSRKVQISVLTQQGDVINMTDSGQYSVRATPEVTRVVNRSGTVTITPANVAVGRIVPANEQGAIIYSVNPSEVVVSDTYINLLTNSTFEEIFVPSSDTNGQSQPFVQDWACIDNSQPPGNFHPELSDGRRVLRLVRDDNASSHGDTGCIRYLGADALDVTSYNYLGIRATFNLLYQSVSYCGIEASECPLMLRIQYYDAAGGKRDWYHGFYYLARPEDNYRLQCSSCLQEHEAINEKAWYTYDSGNLLDLIPPDQKPVKILNVQFYASGHQYDVYVGEVALLAGAAANSSGG